MPRIQFMAKLRSLILGDTIFERKCRFILGVGILAVVSASLLYSFRELDSLVSELDCLGRQQNVSTSGLGGDLARVDPFKLPSMTARFTEATHRRRAHLIAAGEVASILAMIYSGAVIRYILQKTERT